MGCQRCDECECNDLHPDDDLRYAQVQSLEADLKMTQGLLAEEQRENANQRANLTRAFGTQVTLEARVAELEGVCKVMIDELAGMISEYSEMAEQELKDLEHMQAAIDKAKGVG